GRSYFQWILGKGPHPAIEVVSDDRADEPGGKLRLYERLDLRYYVIHDPPPIYYPGILRPFQLRRGKVAALDPRRVENDGLGLTMWDGEYQGETRSWLRWCDSQGAVLPTAEERVVTERQRADAAEEQNRRLLALLKQHGIDPNQ